MDGFESTKSTQLVVGSAHWSVFQSYFALVLSFPLSLKDCSRCLLIDFIKIKKISGIH